VSAPPRRAHPALWPALLVAASLLLLVLPALDPSLQLYDRDTSRCEGPFKWELWRRLAAHQLPLWVSWTEAGTSLLGQMTPGLFHPSTLLYLLPLPFELLFKLQHLLALPLAAAGLYLFARGCGAGRYGAAGGAIAYAGSGWVVSMASSNLHYALGAAAIPWALWGLDRFLASRRPLALLGGAWALSWPVVAGEPQSALLGGLLGVALALGGDGLHAEYWHRNDWLPTRLRRLGWTALWGAAALALCAPAGAPVLLRLRSMATAPGPSAGREHYALPPWRLAGLFLPGAFDETLETTPTGVASTYEELSPRLPGTPFAQGIALGVPALLLALFAPRRQRRWLLGGALVCALAALGPRAPVDALLLRLMPPLHWFRYPEKWIATATLLLALAAALGASALFEPGELPQEPAREPSPAAGANGSRLLPTALGAAALLALGWALLTIFSAQAQAVLAQAMKTHSTAAAALFAARLRCALAEESALALALAGLSRLHQAWAGARAPLRAAGLCTALLGVSALVDSGSLLYTMPLAELRGPLPVADDLRARGNVGPGPLRIQSAPDMTMPVPSDNIRAAVVLWRSHALATQYNGPTGIESVSSYSSLDDNDYQELLHRAPEVLRSLFDVQFVLEPERRVPLERRRAEGWEPMPLGLAMRHRPPSPRAFWAPCALALEHGAAVAKLMSPGFDPHRLAIAREEDGTRLNGVACSPESSRAAPRWTRPRPETIDVELDAAKTDAPALLVVAEHFDPGWRVSIDGGPEEPALQIDRAAMGAVVPPGARAVRFRFFPRGLAAGLWLAGLCAFALLGWAALDRRARMRGA